MVAELSTARDEIQRASELVDDAGVRTQLRSIDEGLMEITHGSETPGVKTTAAVPEGDDLEELEAKVVDLASECDGRARTHMENARDEIDAFRRQYTKDW